MPLARPLVEAYRATSYWVETPAASHRLRVGTLHPEFERVLHELGCVEWAYLTACNPRSVLCSPAENTLRNAELHDLLLARGHTVWPGRGCGDDGQWPPEPSWCALGLPRDDALEIARTFDQHALIVGRRGHPPKLLFTNEPPQSPQK